MAMRAATMSPMITPDHETYIREPSYFFRKLVLLVLLVTATALWTVLLFKGQDQFPLMLSTSFTDIALGLVAGFGSRVVLYKRGLFLQTLIGILLAVFGVILAGSVSNSVLGMGPITLQPSAAAQLSELTFSTDLPEQIGSLKIEPGELLDLEKMNWADPLHLLGSLFMAMTALYAWRDNSPYSTQQVDVMPLEPVSIAEPRPMVRTSASSNGRSRTNPRGGLFARLRAGSHTGNGSRPSNRIRPMVFRDPKATNAQRSKSRRRRSRSKSQIQFAVVEEHRCPYCLDSVTRNDPRGVKECEVCHTLHHADCWAITGVCQVPHLNT
jgi:hypothetical protein